MSTPSESERSRLAQSILRLRTALTIWRSFTSEFGEYAQAEPLLQRALQIREKALGPENPDVVSTLNNLAQLYQNTGDHARAESLLNRALEISQKVFGHEHRITAIVLNNLARLYHQSGEYSKAEPLYERALHINEKTLGRDHPDVTMILTNLAWLNLDAHRIADAHALAVKSAASQLKSFSNIFSFCSEPPAFGLSKHHRSLHVVCRD